MSDLTIIERLEHLQDALKADQYQAEVCYRAAQRIEELEGVIAEDNRGIENQRTEIEQLQAENTELKERNNMLEVYVDNSGPKYVQKSEYETKLAQTKQLEEARDIAMQHDTESCGAVLDLTEQVEQLQAENRRLILKQGHAVAEALKDRINGVDPEESGRLTAQQQEPAE